MPPGNWTVTVSPGTQPEPEYVYVSPAAIVNDGGSLGVTVSDPLATSPLLRPIANEGVHPAGNGVGQVERHGLDRARARRPSPSRAPCPFRSSRCTSTVSSGMNPAPQVETDWPGRALRVREERRARVLARADPAGQGRRRGARVVVLVVVPQDGAEAPRTEQLGGVDEPVGLPLAVLRVLDRADLADDQRLADGRRVVLGRREDVLRRPPQTVQVAVVPVHRDRAEVRRRRLPVLRVVLSERRRHHPPHEGVGDAVVPEVVEDVVEGLHVLGRRPAVGLLGAVDRGLVREREVGVLVVERLEVVHPLLEVRVVVVVRVVRVRVADLLRPDVAPRVDVDVDPRAVVLAPRGVAGGVVPARQGHVDALRLEGLAHRVLKGVLVHGAVDHSHAPERVLAALRRLLVVAATGIIRRLGTVAGRAGQRPRGESRDEQRGRRHGDEADELAHARACSAVRSAPIRNNTSTTAMPEHQQHHHHQSDRRRTFQWRKASSLALFPVSCGLTSTKTRLALEQEPDSRGGIESFCLETRPAIPPSGIPRRNPWDDLRQRSAKVFSRVESGSDPARRLAGPPTERGSPIGFEREEGADLRSRGARRAVRQAADTSRSADMAVTCSCSVSVTERARARPPGPARRARRGSPSAPPGTGCP